MLEWKTEHPDQAWAASAVCLKRSPASPHPRHWPTSWCAGRSVRWLYRTPGRSPGGTERGGKTEAKQIRKSDQDGQNHWSLHHRNCFKAISVSGSGGFWSSERLCAAASSLQSYIVIPALVCSIVWWWSGISPGQPYPWKQHYIIKSFFEMWNPESSFQSQAPTSVSDFLPTRLCKSQKCFQKGFLCFSVLSSHNISMTFVLFTRLSWTLSVLQSYRMTDTTHICQTHCCVKMNIFISDKASQFSLPCHSLTISVPALWYHLLAAFSFWSQYL